MREQIYLKTGTIQTLKGLCGLYTQMGESFRLLGRTEEAGKYYQKALDAGERIYRQTGTARDMELLFMTYCQAGDNKHALGLYDEAHAYRLKALELSEQYDKLYPDAQKLHWVFRKALLDEVKQSETKKNSQPDNNV
jgi:tetratricopeptide (TPR) repeat protein